MNENCDTNEIDKDKRDSLSNILMMRSHKTLDEFMSDYTYYDENGARLSSLLYDLNSLEVELHDVITKNVFRGIDYYKLVCIAPTWVRDAGHSQEASMTKARFESLLEYNNNPITHKFLYYHDCEMLMSAFQNRTQAIEHMINSIFKHLSPELRSIKEYEEVVFSSCRADIDLHVFLNSLIITLASSFDLITKVAHELLHMHEVSFEGYPKMKSAKVTYGDRVRLSEDLKVEQTLFAENEPIYVRQIMSLRDEIIHNGSLDFRYSSYHGIIDGKIDDFLFFPEMTESGVLLSHKARRKFYSDYNRTFNVILPQLVCDVLECLRHTLRMLIDKFDCPWHENPDERLNYEDEISKWSGLILDGDPSRIEWFLGMINQVKMLMK